MPQKLLEFFKNLNNEAKDAGKLMIKYMKKGKLTSSEEKRAMCSILRFAQNNRNWGSFCINTWSKRIITTPNYNFEKKPV